MLRFISILKSSGSKTLSAFFMLVLFASIFFTSCGLPKNPFIIETVLRSDNYLGPIIVESSNNYLDFTILNIDEVFTNNGINLFYCYSNNETISLSTLNNVKLINTTTYSSPQQIVIGNVIYDIYNFKIGEKNTYTLPSLNINAILADNSSLSGKIQVVASDTSDIDVYLDLSLFLITDLTNNLLTTSGRFVRYTDNVSYIKESIILDTYDSDISNDISDYIIINEEYFLHIFGSYYANEPSYEVDHDSVVASSKVTYIGSIVLP